MEYKSQIRDSEMNILLEKAEKKNYGKYLYEMELENIILSEVSQTQKDSMAYILLYVDNRC